MLKRVFKLVLLVSTCFLIQSCSPQNRISRVNVPKPQGPKEYYAAFLNGKRIGYSVKGRTVESDKVINDNYEFMKLSRMGTTIEQEMYTKHVETLDGKPIAFEYIEYSDSKTWIFRDKKNKIIKGEINHEGLFEATKTINGKTRSLKIDQYDSLVLAEKAKLLLKGTNLKQGEKFSTREIFLYDPFEISRYEYKIGKRKQVKLINNSTALTEVFALVRSKRFGKINLIGYVDTDLNFGKAVTKFGGFTLELISCSPQMALGKVEDVDIIKMGIVKCPVRLNNLDKADEIKYHLKPENDMKIKIPSGDNQTVKQLDGGRLILVAHPVKAPDGIPFPYSGDNKLALEALKSTELLQSDHEKIIALSRKAVGKTKDAVKAARKIESFVNGYVRPSGGTMFASALETANERKGDCSEYAVLTAALCRAAGIPARIVMGYVYVDYYMGNWNVFATHLWTEAYIGDKWIGLDATKNRFFGTSKSFNAGYIALSYPDMDISASGLNAIKAFKIERVEQ